MAHRGVVQLDPTAAAKLVARLSPPPAGMASRGRAPMLPAAAGLTEREREVMELVASGANNREIAERLVISEGTVKSHISSILSQLGLRDRTQIAVFVHQQRLASE
jgi:DNA-binding NarL/FixJ family response regulator